MGIKYVVTQGFSIDFGIISYFFFHLCLVDWEECCNFALPNNERGFGETEEKGLDYLIIDSRRVKVYGINLSYKVNSDCKSSLRYW